ncbi:WD40 repeat domain-containing protein [Treponema sp. Marseille-Q4130]|uniref:WD40 repeat domain-containing protein n=1 Tax=Treponema sp. Marseille-Q4130 TaxID=2766702 RepID=UPI00165290A5|nr:WD40 repeat domain-containing protein [Treponema sp. Marseille-Q4130]MBC6719284.1 WD40 repeat domain-containing protein [Treponema sp. Marseille-Q4130]
MKKLLKGSISTFRKLGFFQSSCAFAAPFKVRHTVFFAAVLLSALPLASESHISTQKHEGEIRAVSVSRDGSAFFTAGDDGFLIKWTGDDQGEHYQISDMSVKLCALSPDGKTIAAYETDGGLVNRVSLWDFDTQQRKYARRFSDAVTSLSFSAKGTYVIVGTASVEGAIFLRASDGRVADVLKDSTGIISYAVTSASEKTLCTYSPVGFISYYNMIDGKLKRRLSCEANLSDITSFDGDMFFAGTKNDSLYVVSALSGKTSASVSARDPVLLTRADDKDVYYIASTASRTYSLSMLENRGDKTFSSPRILKNFKSLPNGEAIRAGAKAGDEIVLASSGGNVYRTTPSPDTALLALVPFTEDIYEKISDAASAEDGFYFLTRDALYASSYDTGTVDKRTSNDAHTNMSICEGGVILWSRGTKRAIEFFDFTENKTVPLFTPESSVQSVRAFGNVILEMESNAVVRAYYSDTGEIEELYAGTGLQDALISDGTLYVAKSSATNPPSALLSVDMRTKEIVPLNIASDVVYALSASDDELYGIAVQSSENEKTTNLFSYTPASSKTTMLLKLNDEDTRAFTYFYDGNILTDIGSEKVYSYDLSRKKSRYYGRSASLPVKAVQNGERIAVLNRDGSISWYDTRKTEVLADWYLTKDGTWYEF